MYEVDSRESRNGSVVQDDEAAGRGAVDAGVDAAVDVPAPARALHSDPHDFAGLYIRHRASFTLHARRYLRDARDADEVVQEAFLRLFLALPELETELQALAYCRRTITNLCIDRFRAQARRPSLVDLDSAGAMNLADDDPGDPVVRAEDAAMVRAALSLLSPLHRAALVKREIEEKTLPVIAEELAIPEDSVKHVLFRARRALRRILASTSLAPGSDAEIAGALGKVMRQGSGGLAAFLLLLVLGLGTGPDLRSIPVVGSDLPDLIPVTEIASAVGGAVSSVAENVVEAVKVTGDSEPAAEVTGGDEAPAVAADESPTPSPSAGKVSAAASASASPSPTASASPSKATTATTEPSAEATTREPSKEPSSEPSPTGAGSPSSEPSPSGAGSPSPEGSPSSSASPAGSPSSEASPPGTTTTSGGGSRKGNGKPKASPSPSPTRAQDPEAYKTDGLEWQYDVETDKMVLVPIGETTKTWRDN